MLFKELTNELARQIHVRNEDNLLPPLPGGYQKTPPFGHGETKLLFQIHLVLGAWSRGAKLGVNFIQGIKVRALQTRQGVLRLESAPAPLRCGLALSRKQSKPPAWL